MGTGTEYSLRGSGVVFDTTDPLLAYQSDVIGAVNFSLPRGVARAEVVGAARVSFEIIELCHQLGVDPEKAVGLCDSVYDAVREAAVARGATPEQLARIDEQTDAIAAAEDAVSLDAMTSPRWRLALAALFRVAPQQKGRRHGK